MNFRQNISNEQEKVLKKLVVSLAASRGEFKLIFAHCNYENLQECFAQRLAELYSIKTIRLSQGSTTLYTAIQQQLKGTQPEALQVLGLARVEQLDQVLTSADQVREEFRKNFAFPLILWVDDWVEKRLRRIAPNFQSWGINKELPISQENIGSFLMDKVQDLFSKQFLLFGAERVLFERAIKAARPSLEMLEPSLNVILQANSRVLLGFEKEIEGKLKEAIIDYQAALEMVGDGNELILQNQSQDLPLNLPILEGNASSLLAWRVKLLQQITVCLYRLPSKQQEEFVALNVRNALDLTWKELNRGNSPKLMADSVTVLAEVLQKLGEWTRLQKIAETALEVHQNNNEILRVAEDYGYLAEIALAKGETEKAIELAQFGIERYLRTTDNKAKFLLSWLYCIRGKAQEKLEQFQDAIESFKQAKDLGVLENNNELYIEILNNLQRLYFEQEKDYLEAFKIGQEIITTRRNSGEYAFIGPIRLWSTEKAPAPEIVASGREQNIRDLTERLTGTQHKIVVLSGESGVGKSSLLEAGLIPSLLHKKK